MSDWWDAVERELDARADHAPDPWGALPDGREMALTPEQIDFLAQVASAADALVDADDLTADDLTGDDLTGDDLTGDDLTDDDLTGDVVSADGADEGGTDDDDGSAGAGAAPR